MAQAAVERAASAAPTANPAPLGLSAFALTTFVLSSANAGLFTGSAIVIGLAIFYGGIVQILAGLQEFRAGNTFGATAFCSYGGFWLALGFALLPGSGIVAAYKASTDLHAALGYFLLGWTIFTGLMFLGTLRSNLALMSVFFFLFLTFLSLTIGELGGATTFGTIGGWLGILTAVLAWYTALAGVLAAGRATFQLPVGPRS
jgi:succinate-acetate transporter protein